MCKTIRINRNINSNKKKEKPGEKRIKLSVEYFEKTPFIEKKRKHIMYIHIFNRFECAVHYTRPPQIFVFLYLSRYIYVLYYSSINKSIYWYTNGLCVNIH